MLSLVAALVFSAQCLLGVGWIKNQKGKTNKRKRMQDSSVGKDIHCVSLIT